jgi:hypothetical protein
MRGLAFQDKDQQKANLDLLCSGASVTIVRNYNFEKYGQLISDGTLDWLRRKGTEQDARAVAIALGENTDDKCFTQADNLLRFLKSRADVSYVALYSEAGSSLMTSNQRDFKSLRRLVSVSREGRAAEQWGDAFDFSALDESPDFATYELNQRRAMMITGTCGSPHLDSTFCILNLSIPTRSRREQDAALCCLDYGQDDTKISAVPSLHKQ